MRHRTAKAGLIERDETQATLHRAKAGGNAGRAAADKGKRPADAPAEPGNAAKRGPGASGASPSNASGPSTSAGAGPSIPQPASADYNRLRLQSKTVKDLQAILKAWGLPISGKKEDLIDRIMEKQEAAQGRR